MRINHNISALNTYSRLTGANSAKGKSLEKLSSGLRINKAGDDAAGLAISEKMRSQIKGLNQASRNAQDGISLIQTTEGALNESHSILQRMRELAVQGANDTNTADDRAELQKEMNQLTSELSRIGNDTEFNTKKVLNGDLESAAAANDKVSLDLTTDGAFTADQTSTIVLTLGGSDYTLAFDGTADAADNASAGTTGAIGTATGDISDVDDVVAVLQEMQGENAAATISEFTFANEAGVLTITANVGGDFEGAAGEGAIVVKSGMDTGNVTQTATGTDGTAGAATFQVGANNGQTFSVSVSDMRAANLDVSGATGATTTTNTGSAVTNAVYVTGGDALDENSGSAERALDISSEAGSTTAAEKATAAIEVIDNAIGTVSSQRSKLGAFQNRLDHTINNLETSSENLTAAESRVRDVDMAKEMMEFTKNNILSQASNAMMAQANQMPQSVLQLLQ